MGPYSSRLEADEKATLFVDHAAAMLNWGWCISKNYVTRCRGKTDFASPRIAAAKPGVELGFS